MEVCFDPVLPAHKTPIGAAAQGRTVHLKIGISDERFYDSARVVLTKDGETPVRHRMTFCEHAEGFVRFTIEFSALSVGLYFYRFEIFSGAEVFSIGCGADGRGALGSEACFALTVHAADFSGCPWFRGEIMYHVFVDRFFRPVGLPLPEAVRGAKNPVRNRRFHTDFSEPPDWKPNAEGRILNNDFYGGTLDGVCEKLDYLQSLGVGVLYLSPIFEAASNHKYDTGDYEKIDEGFGGLAAFRRLIRAAHGRGMKIVLDGVFNHTGDDSRYFNRYGEYPTAGAFANPDSPFADWYDFSDAERTRYRSWWGIDILPALNNSEGFSRFLTGEGGVLDRWLGEGADGFRLDVADELSEPLIRKIRARLARYPDKLLIGEVWEDASDKIAYDARRHYFLGNELDCVMNYPLRDAIVEAFRERNFRKLERTVRMLLDHYPKCVLDNLMNMLSTHDTARIATALMRDTKALSRADRAKVVLSGEELAEGLRRQRSAAFLQFFLFGNPSIYYGDEIGMQGAEDPFNRAGMDWARTEDSEMLGFYRKLAEVRRALPELKEGEYRTEFCSPEVFVFSRAGRRFGVNESAKDFEREGFAIPAGGFAVEGVSLS